MSPISGSSRGAISAAYTLTGAVLILGAVGYFLDRKFDTEPYLLLGGLLLGVAVGLYDLWKAMFQTKGGK
ncbi:MAG: AtpZ/AtpI family protein [Candidatus Neomarinimicrobiota bacterium]